MEQTNLQNQFVQPIRLDVVVELIHDNMDAIERCKKLSMPNELPKNMSQIFKCLVHYVGKYVNRGIDM